MEKQIGEKGIENSLMKMVSNFFFFFNKKNTKLGTVIVMTTIFET